MLANAHQDPASSHRPHRLRRPARDRILAEARALLAQGSYPAFTMETVARASSLSRQTLYNQFADRDSLYRQSRRALLDGFVGDLPHRLDRGATLERFIEDVLPVLARPEHVELSRSAEVDGAACPWVALLYRSQVERPLAALARGLIAAALPVADAGALADLLVAMLRAAAHGRAPAFTAPELARLFRSRLAAAVPAPLERKVA